MGVRRNRLSVVRDLIKNNTIENQEMLSDLLRKEGFDVTQATLSRDLKRLNVTKKSNGWSGYAYSLPDEEIEKEIERSYVQDVRQGIISIEFSGNFGVIKTRPGHANSVGVALDIISLPEILGTVAGDDTIFIILREGMTKEDLLKSFNSKIPEVKE